MRLAARLRTWPISRALRDQNDVIALQQQQQQQLVKQQTIQMPSKQ
jgi:hypothetical protein